MIPKLISLSKIVEDKFYKLLFTVLNSLTLITLGFSQVSCIGKKFEGPIIVASLGKIVSLDPAQASTFDALQLLSALGDPLYRLKKGGGLEPRLAKELPLVDDDGLTLLIPLRKDVYFHDGTHFDASAMVFSINRFMEIGILNYVLGGRIDSVEVVEKYLLKLKLTRTSTSLDGLLSSIHLTPISPTAYSEHKNKFLNDRFVGTGPYKLRSFNGQQQRLEPFHRYWGKPPRNLGIDFIKLTNSTALFGAIKTGNVDILLSNSIDADHRLALHKMANEGFLIEASGPPLEIGYITFLTNSSPLNDILVRKALSNSIDRELITKRVSYGQRTPLRSLVPPILKEKDVSLWPKYNPEKARELFQKSGFCRGNILKVPLTFRSNVPADKLLALTWKAQVKRDLSDCLSLKLNGVESTTVYRQLGKGAFSAVILDWRGAYPDPEAYLAPLLSCTKSEGSLCKEGEAVVSGSFWTYPGLQDSLSLSDQLLGAERQSELLKIENHAADGSPYVPVWLVTPKAWVQLDLFPPEFDGSGYLLFEDLRNKENE